MQKTATIPFRIINNRSVLAAIWYTFCAGSSMMVLVYYLPIWFQAIKGVSPVHSGIMNLPALLGITIASITAGLLTKTIGYYAPLMLAGATIMPIGAGLISTFTTHTNHSAWIGYQALWGIGMGLGMQQPSVAVQTVLEKKDVPTGASLVFFAQGIGGALFTSLANNLIDNALKQGLRTIPGIDADIVTNIGATNLRHLVPPQQLESVLVVYNLAIRRAFYIAAAVAAAAMLGALAVEWKSIKAGEGQGRKAQGGVGKSVEEKEAKKESV